MNLRSTIYRALRTWGDVDAARKGPGALAKRTVRRRAHRASNRLTRKMLRRVGL